MSEHEHELEKINNIDTHRPHTSLEHDTRLEQRLEEEEAENNIERDDKKEEEKSLIAASNENSLADRLQRLYIKKSFKILTQFISKNFHFIRRISINFFNCTQKQYLELIVSVSCIFSVNLALTRTCYNKCMHTRCYNKT